MPLFDIAIMQLPTKAETDAGVQPKLVLGPKTISATNQATALFLAGNDLDLPKDVNKDLLEIKARAWG